MGYTRVLRTGATLEKTGLTRSGMYREMAEGRFPKPIKIGARSVGWIEEELDAYIAARVAERDGAQAGR